MGKCFRSADVNQALLLPPSLHDWLPEKHLARFLVDVVDALELAAIYDSYDEKDGRGQAAYDPAMMVRVLLYGYCTGSYSSRQLQAKTYEDIAFRYLAADEHPDHSTLAEFRQRHLEALAGLVPPSVAVVSEGGAGEAGTGGDRWQQDPGQCQQAQGDELWAHERGGEETASGSGSAVAACRSGGCGRGREVRERSGGRGVAGGVGAAGEPAGEDWGSEGGVGSRSQTEGRGKESRRRSPDRTAPGASRPHGQEDERT